MDTVDDAPKRRASDDQAHQQQDDGPSPFERAASLPMPQQSAAAPSRTAKGALAGLLKCSCFRPAADSQKRVQPAATNSSISAAPAPTKADGKLSGQRSSTDAGVIKGRLSQRRSTPLASRTYSNADWCDAVSSFSTSGDQAELMEEVQEIARELGSFKPPPWVPDPPLVFGTPNMHFIKVPAHTGFAAYWERDDVRTTPFPQPIDCMLGAPFWVKRTHASIPGIWIQETPTQLTITATPSFIPPLVPVKGYEETYDKSNATEPSWIPRRDMKMGRAWGKLYMTAEGMLIARVWQRPAFSNELDIIMEEYMILEEEGNVIVDRMTCLHVPSGKRASQYLVGCRREVPPRSFMRGR